MLEEMVQFVNEKAEEMLQEVTEQFLHDSPASPMDDEIKKKVLERATSQLMFNLGTKKFNAEEDLEKQFEAWYDDEKRENLKKACARCLKEEMDERMKSGKSNLTNLERYLMEHGISLNEE